MQVVRLFISIKKNAEAYSLCIMPVGNNLFTCTSDMVKKRNILDYNLSARNQKPERRRHLMPRWMIVFCWFFMLLAFPLVINLYLLLDSYIYVKPPIYGLDKVGFIPFVDFYGHFLLLFKAVVAFSLWTERRFAVSLAFVDAYAGLAVHATVYYVLPFFGEGPSLTTGSIVEMAMLLPYLLILYQMKAQWLSLHRLQ